MKMADNTELCLDLILCRLFAEIICGEMPDKVRALRFDAIRRLQGQLQFYKDRGFVNKLLCGIAEKRGAMILKATSQTEMEHVMNPHAPHYDGTKFVPDPYSVPEEEMVAWSEASLRGPLIEAAQKRYTTIWQSPCRMTWNM